MASALRQRAVTEAAAAAVGGRMEPRLEPAGVDVPVMTDEVELPSGPPRWRVLLDQLPNAMPTWPARWRVAPKVLAISLLGLVTTLLAAGLALYFWPSSAPEGPKAGAAAAVAAAAPADAYEPAASARAVPTVSARRAKDVPSIVPPLPAAAVAEAPIVIPPPSPVASSPVAAAPASAPAATAPAKPAPPAAPIAAVVPPASPQPAPAVAPEPAAVVDTTFGVDATGNGVPDALDRWVARSLRPPATQEAARSYYTTVLPLATKAHLGIGLSLNEKRTALRAAECYLVTATDDGLRSPPNLNDQVLRLGGEAAARMKGLFQQLQGVDYPVSGRRQQACG